jgi:hypothetical protein
MAKIMIIDIDGTVSEDIKNEDSHLYKDAKVLNNSLEIVNKWHDEGNIIYFFTARESKDRDVTENWLKEKGFKFHGLLMDKPRCLNNDDEYVYIDNRPVRAITYKGIWSELIETETTIKTFRHN